MASSLDYARELDSWGFNLLPARPRGKAPLVKWQDFQNKRSSAQLEGWFSREGLNFWVVCGRISHVVVLDCDGEGALRWWQERLGDVLAQTTTVKTAKGWHFYFRVADDDLVGSWSMHDDVADIHFDVRAEGTGVLAPPSIHPSGVAYAWVEDRGPSAMLPLPEILRSGSPRAATDGAGDTQRAGDRGRDKKAAPGLAELLRAAPERDGEGRNVWLTRVAGYLAKWVPERQAYEELIHQVNLGLAEPLAPEEAGRVAESIWKKESRRLTVSGDREEIVPNEDNGFLVGDGERLWSPVKRGEETRLEPWSNFDMRVFGVVESNGSGEGRSYEVELLAPERQPDRIRIPSRLFGRQQELDVFLAGHGVSIMPPPGDRYWRHGRLERYLEAQEAPHFHAVDALGWYSEAEGIAGGGFICHEGVIDATGFRPHEGLAPAPTLQDGRAPYRYGFGDEEDVRAILREVLSFHYRSVAAVFGAWWAASFLKGLMRPRVSQFPFMALEAPSESGKTKGMFSLLIALAGNSEGHGESTLAVLRDRAAAHRNGIIWIDDMSQPDLVLDLLRQATSEGSRSKKTQDRTTQTTVKMVAPVVISGEGLGALSREKALADRAIRLEVPSPVDRLSTRPGREGRPQWDDIVELQLRWPRLWEVAGTVVQLALRESRWTEKLQELRPGAGRWADKIAAIRVGARVLGSMIREDWVVEEVEHWVARQRNEGQENVLTKQVLPRLLDEHQFPRRALGFVPAFVDEDRRVWFSEARTANAWARLARTPRDRQLGELESIRAQRQALGIEERRRLAVNERESASVSPIQRTYWGLPADLSAEVLARADAGAWTDAESAIASLHEGIASSTLVETNTQESLI